MLRLESASLKRLLFFTIFLITPFNVFAIDSGDQSLALGQCLFHTKNDLYQVTSTDTRLILEFPFLKESQIKCQLPQGVRRSFIIRRNKKSLVRFRLPKNIEAIHEKTPQGVQVLFVKPLASSSPLKPSSLYPAFTHQADYRMVLEPSPYARGLCIRWTPLLGTFDPIPKLAIFKHSGYLWIASSNMIDYRQTESTSLPDGYGPYPEFLKTSPGSFVIRLKIPNISGLIWSLEKDPQNPSASVSFYLDERTVELASQSKLMPSPLKHLAFSSVGNLEELQIQVPQLTSIKITNPDNKEPFLVFPLATSGSVFSHICYSDFEILPSMQGLVFALRGEGIHTRNESNFTSLTHPQGLFISSIEDRNSPLIKGSPELFDFQNWFYKEKIFSQDREALEQSILVSRGQERLTHELNLARLCLAYEFGPEASGILKRILQKYPLLKQDPVMITMQGLAAFFQGQFQKAIELFSNPFLSPEAQLWKGAAMIEEGLTKQGLELMANHMERLKLYPSSIRANLALLGADAALSQSPVIHFENFIKLLEGVELTFQQKRSLETLERDKSIRVLSNFTIWSPTPRRIARSTSDRSAADNAIKAIYFQYQSGKLKMADMIERLKALKESWRGGILEYATLEKLGALYEEIGNPTEALNNYQYALKVIPSSTQNAVLKKKIIDLFIKTLLKSPGLSPFERIIFFETFQSVLPLKNSQRPHVIHQITQDMLDLDLVPDAIALLESALDELPKTYPYLSQRIKAYLREQMPDKALKIFQEPVVLSDTDEENAWKLLHAESLMQNKNSKKVPEVLDQLPYLPSQQALKIQASWHQGNFAKAAVELEEELKNSEIPNVDSLIRFAIALGYTKNEKKLYQIRQSYSDILPKNQKRQIFLILTQSLKSTHMSTNEIKKSLLAVEDFQYFSKPNVQGEEAR